MTNALQPQEETRVAIREDSVPAEIVDDSTGSQVTSTETALVQADPYYGAGALQLPKTVQQALSAPIDPNDLSILPTGEVYLPQVGYRRRLNDAVGIGNWALRPLADPKVVGKTVARWYALYINGQFVSETWGEADFIEGNPRLTWATALESAKSNALMRCCKDIGIALDCWDKSFTDGWKRKFATQQGGKWSRRDQPIVEHERLSAPVETKAQPLITNTETKPAPIASGGTQIIRPAKFGKKWNNGNRPCIFVHDAEGNKWTFSGSKHIAAAEAAINAQCEIMVTFTRSGDYLNVTEVAEVPA